MLNIFKELWRAQRRNAITIDDLYFTDTLVLEDSGQFIWLSRNPSDQCITRKREDSTAAIATATTTFSNSFISECIKSPYNRDDHKQSDDSPYSQVVVATYSRVNESQEIEIEHFNTAQITSYLSEREFEQALSRDSICIQKYLHDNKYPATSTSPQSLMRGHYIVVDFNAQNNTTCIASKHNTYFLPQSPETTSTDAYNCLLAFEAPEEFLTPINISSYTKHHLAYLARSIVISLDGLHEKQSGKIKEISLIFKSINQTVYLLHCNRIEFELESHIPEHMRLSFNYPFIVPMHIKRAANPFYIRQTVQEQQQQSLVESRSARYRMNNYTARNGLVNAIKKSLDQIKQNQQNVLSTTTTAARDTSSSGIRTTNDDTLRAIGAVKSKNRRRVLCNTINVVQSTHRSQDGNRSSGRQESSKQGSDLTSFFGVRKIIQRNTNNNDDSSTVSFCELADVSAESKDNVLFNRRRNSSSNNISQVPKYWRQNSSNTALQLQQQISTIASDSNNAQQQSWQQQQQAKRRNELLSGKSNSSNVHLSSQSQQGYYLHQNIQYLFKKRKSISLQKQANSNHSDEQDDKDGDLTEEPSIQQDSFSLFPTEVVAAAKTIKTTSKSQNSNTHSKAVIGPGRSSHRSFRSISSTINSSTIEDDSLFLKRYYQQQFVEREAKEHSQMVEVLTNKSDMPHARKDYIRLNHLRNNSCLRSSDILSRMHSINSERNREIAQSDDHEHVIGAFNKIYMDQKYQVQLLKQSKQNKAIQNQHSLLQLANRHRDEAVPSNSAAGTTNSSSMNSRSNQLIMHRKLEGTTSTQSDEHLRSNGSQNTKIGSNTSNGRQPLQGNQNIMNKSSLNQQQQQQLLPPKPTKKALVGQAVGSNIYSTIDVLSSGRAMKR